MTISYKWLCEYLPVEKNNSPYLDPERLARILTSIGLEVESFNKFEEVKGGLKGLVIGEVLSAEKHPNADKLTLAKVNTGNGEPLQIVCGAPNVAAGQKVVVAKVGTTIYPTAGEPLTMKIARIRNVESYGMICAEDEIGLGTSHEGIMVLDPKARAGMAVSEYFQPYEDWIYELGITPNRMDAMSHWGVAKDVCAYLNYHDKKDFKPRLPHSNSFKADNNSLAINVKIENTTGCQRYSGISFSNVTVKESPTWLKQRLKSIGLRPINNIVDITNFIQHETGQPLHAFNADMIEGKTIVVKNIPEGTKFITLDEKERKLSADDLMICDAKKGLCIAGVFGGLNSGVTEKTKNIFLESAWFHPTDIRKTSFRHNLRTDAATRFEKNVDISGTASILKRAALMIKELSGADISSNLVDVYPDPVEKTQVSIKYHYLKKLSGRNYHPDSVKDILTSLGFEVIKEGIDELRVSVPYSKPDITLPADIVEEVLRIEGLDNIPIPQTITITPSVDVDHLQYSLKEKTAGYLVGLGFNEIMTNSITNSEFYDEEDLVTAVKMINNLSAELNILRPSMLETGLASIAHNLNRKNNDLKFFEFGRTYQVSGPGKYKEKEILMLYLTGDREERSWRNKPAAVDFYLMKGYGTAIMKLIGLSPDAEIPYMHKKYNGIQFSVKGKKLVTLGTVSRKELSVFDIKQPVFFAEFSWEELVQLSSHEKIDFHELPRFPAVHRDLAMIVDRSVSFGDVEKLVNNLKLFKLQEVKLFDIFESERLGKDKKSLAISFTFLDEEKTLTDKEIDTWMDKIRGTMEKDLRAEIRK